MNQEKEIWKKLVLPDGREHPWYSVSTHGNMLTHLQNKSMGSRGFDRSYNPNHSRPLTPKPHKKRKSDDYASMRVNLRFPDNFFEDYDHYKNHNGNTVERKFYVHQLVMSTHRPMNQFPPDKLKDCWDDVPSSAKEWIIECTLINHKDHNPQNNNVDNLEYETPSGNTRKAVEFYGGNCANKGKNKVVNDDEFIVFSEPQWNAITQEWDQTITFEGSEGEECYDMLCSIAKRENKDLSDVWIDIMDHASKEMEKWER